MPLGLPRRVYAYIHGAAALAYLHPIVTKAFVREDVYITFYLIHSPVLVTKLNRHSVVYLH